MWRFLKSKRRTTVSVQSRFVICFFCFRLLLMLGDEELLKPPYNIENQAHRRAILAELDRVKALGVKPPQNLWEYKVKRLLCTKALIGPHLPISLFRVLNVATLVCKYSFSITDWLNYNCVCQSSVSDMYNQMIIFLLCILISVTFYQDANAGKSLFLLYALKRSPRLTLFYLYLFDYSETFLPFLHTCCPANTHIDHSLESSFLNTQVTQKQCCWC